MWADVTGIVFVSKQDSPEEGRAERGDPEEEDEEDEEEKELWRYVKAADKISALIKCVEEKRMGNMDFEQAERATVETIREMKMPEADYFLEHFMPAYSLTLDEQSK